MQNNPAFLSFYPLSLYHLPGQRGLCWKAACSFALSDYTSHLFNLFCLFLFVLFFGLGQAKHNTPSILYLWGYKIIPLTRLQSLRKKKKAAEWNRMGPKRCSNIDFSHWLSYTEHCKPPCPSPTATVSDTVIRSGLWTFQWTTVRCRGRKIKPNNADPTVIYVHTNK